MGSLPLPPKNVIVRMPNWLGDLVMATPLLEDLRHHFPTIKLTAMCQSNVAGLLQHNPHIDEILSFKRPSGWLGRQAQQDIISPLRRGKYDLGILTTNSFSSAWWFWRGHVDDRIGFAGNWRSFLLSQAIPFPKRVESQHLVKTYKALLAPLGIPESETPPRLYLSKEELQQALQLLQNLGVNPQEQLIVGINPGAAYGTAKCWLPDRFEAVTRLLLKDPKVVVLYFGDQAGAPLIETICRTLPERVHNLAGKTNLRQLLALLSYCQVLLTNDSGPMHIAAALKIPLVAIFGSTSDVKTGPYGTAPMRIIHKRVACSPCYKRVCPIDFRCMTSISVEEVYQAMLELLGTRHPLALHSA